MDFQLDDDHLLIRDGVTKLCEKFPERYWIEVDERQAYPAEFVAALDEAGWLAILIPEEYGGGGRGAVEAAIVLEAINRSGGSAGAAHAQMYTMGTILRHGTIEQKESYLPRIADGSLRLQAFGITEANAGSDTTRIESFAERSGDEYVVRGSKVFISRVEYSDLMLLLVRTTPYSEVAKKHDGLTTLLVDLRSVEDELTVRRIPTIVNHHAYELTFDDMRVPVANRIGEEGQGFRYILSGMNMERVLVCSEHLGNGYWFVDRAVAYAREREIFGRPIGQNQGVQFPLALAHAHLEAASAIRYRAATQIDSGLPAGSDATMAKLLASQAAWEAANAAMDTFGGYGVTTEYGIGRKLASTRLGLVAPISNNLALAHIAQNVLKLPKSY